MSYCIGAHGVKDIVIPAGQKIAIWSAGQAKLYSLTGYPNQPPTWALTETTDVGEEYVSDAYTYATTVRVESLELVVYYEVGAAPTISSPLADQSFADATGVIAGLAAAQGGSATLKGGTSSTAANAGGAAALLGGQAGAEGVGGAATVTGAVGGATSGVGGAATVTGGAGTAGNSAGGAASVTGGAGQGTAAGGAASLVGGASGAGATGNGGNTSVTGGAAASTNGNGGNVILTPGAKAGSGYNGNIRLAGSVLRKQGAQTAKTVSATLTAAEVLAGIITVNQGAGAASELTLPLATAMDTGFPNAAADDAFDFSVINISTTDAEDATILTNTGWTLVGNMEVQAQSANTLNTSGLFRARRTGAGAWTLYRLA